MDYILMHKNIPVCEISLNDREYSVDGIGEMYNYRHLPVGVGITEDAALDVAELNTWWTSRSIPWEREGIREALAKMRVADPLRLAARSNGLSLTDHYWLCPRKKGVLWAQINFFTNEFSDEMGNVLMDGEDFGKQANLCYPDNTTNGVLKKKWCILGGSRCMIKGGSGVYRQEPYNEVFASILLDRLRIRHVPYTLLSDPQEEPLCLCGDFVTPENEFVSAGSIMKKIKKKQNVSFLDHFLNCCDRLGIMGARAMMDRMLVLDYLLVNEDRDWNSFGFMRDPESLSWLYPAPFFDNGASLWYHTPTEEISASADRGCKPFRARYSEQIKLVSSFDWISWDNLDYIEEEFRELTSMSSYIDEERRDRICTAIAERVEKLKKTAQKRKEKKE